MGLFLGISLLAWTIAIILLYSFFSGLSVEKFEKYSAKSLSDDS